MSDLDLQAIRERAADLRQWADLTKSDAMVAIMREDADLFELLLADREALREVIRDLVLNEPVQAFTARWYALAEALIPANACELLGRHVCGSNDGEATRETIAALARLSSASQETP